MQVNPTIFKAYDIRGLYPADLNEQVAYLVGRAFVTFLGINQAMVGRDMRLFGPPCEGRSRAASPTRGQI